MLENGHRSRYEQLLRIKQVDENRSRVADELTDFEQRGSRKLVSDLSSFQNRLESEILLVVIHLFE